jgi:hypothetical protein
MKKATLAIALAVIMAAGVWTPVYAGGPAKSMSAAKFEGGLKTWLTGRNSINIHRVYEDAQYREIVVGNVASVDAGGIWLDGEYFAFEKDTVVYDYVRAEIPRGMIQPLQRVTLTYEYSHLVSITITTPTQPIPARPEPSTGR